MLKVIRRNVVPGTIIWTDEWRGYNNLQRNGYGHETVNHSQEYVDPNTGVHTNNIEARWNACKAKFRARWGTRRHLIPGYLDEYMWRCRRAPSDYFSHILAAIRRQYPV